MVEPAFLGRIRVTGSRFELVEQREQRLFVDLPGFKR